MTINTHSQVEIGDSLFRITARGKFRDKDALDFVPTPESSLLHIDTPNYDGPLDLLLHLIRKHSMDIFDIPIVLITHKYLAALEEMHSLNLDIAGDFLVMAATLAEIKSVMLLPKEEQKNNEEDLLIDNVDPRAELTKRLLTYQMYQDAAMLLMQRPQSGLDIFIRSVEAEEIDVKDENEEVKIAPLLIFDLVDSLSHVLKKSTTKTIHMISRERISVSARIHELIEFCQIRTKFSFYDVIKFFPINDKIDIIVNFLAILEMARLKLLKISIDNKECLSININKENFYTSYQEILKNIEHKKGEDNL